LPDFIVKLYRKRCGKDGLDTVRSIEEMAAAKRAKTLAKKAKAMRRRTPILARHSARPQASG